MKYLFCGYRDWAKSIFCLISDENWVFIETTEDLNRIDTESFDLMFFVGWSEILSEKFLADRKSVCLHPSKLPYYRGGSPIQHQVISGVKESAVTLFIMNDKLDEGDIVYQEEISLSGDIDDIFNEIIEVGAKGIRSVANSFEKSELKAIEQEKHIYKPYRRRKPSDSRICASDLEYLSAKDIHNMARTLKSPYPNAYIELKDGSKLYLKDTNFQPATKTINKKRALLLGHRGMLGHMVLKYISKSVEVETIDYRFPSDEFRQAVFNYKGDYLINCIGSIPQRTNNFEVNADLPIWLEQNANCRIIHPSTDCEIDDTDYGLSKRKGTEYLLSHGRKTKILQTSIIGPELKEHRSFLDWYVYNAADSVEGYKDALWSGITTLQWSKFCRDMISHWDNYKRMNVVAGEVISKYSLLKIIKEIFDVRVDIIPVDKGKDKSLKGELNVPPIKDQLLELKAFYYD